MNNIIYLTTASKNKLIESLYICGEVCLFDDLIFHKKNNNIRVILDIFFPNVLSSIIINYHIEIIIVEFVFMNFGSSYDFSFKNNEYNFDIEIEFKNISYWIVENFMINNFGIEKSLNPIIYLNRFMLQYYHKKEYLKLRLHKYMQVDYVPNYTNCKKLKYAIIMTRILCDIILKN